VWYEGGRGYGKEEGAVSQEMQLALEAEEQIFP
jgi:hypothetical protein